MKNNLLLLRINTYLFALLFFCSPKLYNQTLTAEQIYKKVTAAVVVVHAYDDNNQLAKQGSGVVINDKGYVVTNYHVLSGCDKIEILHNKETVPYVDIIGIDVEKDILILKIDAKKFPAIKIGDSKNLSIGQRVYAVGSPLGFENTISEGIISGLRSYEESQKNFIQITASISSGSSGGAVVNDKGELIGISTLTASEGQNLNFAIPINIVLGVEINSYLKNDVFKDFELEQKGWDALKRGENSMALKFYSQYIDKFPHDWGAYLNRGISKHFLNDYRGAIQDYSKAIEINPNAGAQVYSNRGSSKSFLNDYKGALQDFNKAIEIDKNFADAYYNLGITRVKIEDYREAIQDYNKAIEINPNNASYYYNRGIAKRSLEDYRGAIQDYNKALEISPNNVSYYNNRGNAKRSLEDYRGAIQDYNKAIEINPNDAISFYNRGIAKYNLGDRYGACKDMSNAGELGIDRAYDFIREQCN